MTLDSLNIQIKRIPFGDYSMMQTINQTAHGIVKVCVRKDLNTLSSVKILSKQSVLKSFQEDHVRNEAMVLSAVEHPFICAFEGFGQCDRNLYLFS